MALAVLHWPPRMLNPKSVPLHRGRVTRPHLHSRALPPSAINGTEEVDEVIVVQLLGQPTYQATSSYISSYIRVIEGLLKYLFKLHQATPSYIKLHQATPSYIKATITNGNHPTCDLHRGSSADPDTVTLGPSAISPSWSPKRAKTSRILRMRRVGVPVGVPMVVDNGGANG